MRGLKYDRILIILMYSLILPNTKYLNALNLIDRLVCEITEFSQTTERNRRIYIILN